MLDLIFIVAFTISLGMNIIFHANWQNERRTREFYEFWNKIHTDTLFNLIKGENKHD